MNVTDRSAAIALKAAERPDVRALRSALSKVERNFDGVLALQDAEIRRLRRLLLRAVRVYRDMAAADWHTSKARLAAFTKAFDDLCLEADAIVFAEGLEESARKRG